MAVDLTTIFGSEIKVTLQPRFVHRQYAGFPGGEGLTAMLLGSRGYQLIIRGTLRAVTRPLLVNAISAIEQYLWAGAGDYSFAGTVYYFLVFEKLEVPADSRGKGFHLTSEGWVTCKFVCHARGLI